MLVGADANGRKELLAIEDGYRESTQSWRELLLRLRDENGLKVAPELATGDGALGFWKALHEIWPKTCQQRCWVHKTTNVLNALPKSVHGKARKDLHAIVSDGVDAPRRHRCAKVAVLSDRNRGGVRGEN